MNPLEKAIHAAAKEAQNPRSIEMTKRMSAKMLELKKKHKKEMADAMEEIAKEYEDLFKG